MSDIERVKSLIRTVPDFPVKGILFKDIFPIFQDPTAVETLISLDARGFLFGPILALRLGAAFVPVRKQGKLPGEIISAEFVKEYGVDVFEMQKEAIKPGQNVIIVDDLIATGGTAHAAGKLVEGSGGKILEYIFIVELIELNVVSVVHMSTVRPGFPPNKSTFEWCSNLNQLDKNGYVEGNVLSSSLSYHIHTIFRIQLSYELGEYYFSRDIGKSVAYLCKCAIEGDPYESTVEYKSFCTIDKKRLSALIKGTGFLMKKFPPYVQIEYFKENQNYEGIYLILSRSFINNNSKVDIKLEQTRNLVIEAVRFGQMNAAIKIAFYNAFNLPSNASIDEMFNEIPEYCFQYLENTLDEELIIELIELLKTKYGNFFGQNLSENQRKFVSLFFQKIENDEIWKIIRNIEGLEFTLPLLPITNFPSIFTTVDQCILGANDRTITFPNIVDTHNVIKKNEGQIHWEDLNESYFIEDKINDERFVEIEDLCFKTLNNFPLLDLPVLENITFRLLDNYRWKFLSNFLTSLLNSKPKDEWMSQYFSIHRFCEFMISCIEIFKLYSPYAQDDLEKTNQKEFELILKMKQDELKYLRSISFKLIKVLNLTNFKCIEPAFNTLARLKNVKWVHHIIMSLIAGYILCNQKERSEQKQLNHRFYSPFMILMMTSKCAKELWPKEKFNEIEKILDTKKKFTLYDLMPHLLYLCIESEKHNEPKFLYDIRIADIYHLQGLPIVSLRHNLNAIAIVTSSYTFLEKLEELWPIHTIRQMISCCLSLREIMAAIVLHQFIEQENSLLSATKGLIDFAIESRALQATKFTKYIFDVELLQYICDRLFRKEDMFSFNQISKWLKSSLKVQTPSIFRKNYVAEAQSTKYQNNRQNFNAKYRLRRDANCINIDKKKQEIEIEELKHEFLHELTVLVDEGNNDNQSNEQNYQNNRIDSMDPMETDQKSEQNLQNIRSTQ
ncbi:3844_t:CDS:10 [Diversispora eburnea]|uniref:adenine phosphoribosyltransferase n=1 Tax=Diversispora eburnea TaxID=1213867 RepID=A0A9N8V3S4_9GLOM|nr:3844_t:CDS:10 [Diversispora eburnea]